MGSERNYRDLVAWQRSMDFGVQVTKLARSLSRHDRWVFETQLRRAAWSVPANVAEGRERQHTREYLQHTFIGRGSLAEAETYLTAIDRTCEVDRVLLGTCFDLSDEVARLLNGLSFSLRAKLRSS